MSTKRSGLDGNRKGKNHDGSQGTKFVSYLRGLFSYPFRTFMRLQILAVNSDTELRSEHVHSEASV